MKAKLLNLLLILTALAAYLEWGGDNKMFLWQGELDLLWKLVSDPKSAVHPFTLLPLFGQIFLFITLFQKNPSKTLTYIGIGCIGVLLLFIFFIGIFSLNLRMGASALPFILAAVLAVLYHRMAKKEDSYNR